MTDRIIIYKFLKNFEIRIQSHSFVMIDKVTKQEFKNSEFATLFLKVFDTYNTDENKQPIDICQEWYDKQKKKYTKLVDKYLSDCTVTLGTCNWEVKKPNGSIVNDEKILKLFGKKFDGGFLRDYYNRWFGEVVLDASEKIWDTF